MADLSSYTYKFRVTGDSFPLNGSNKVNKRNRPRLSCLACRSRKLKCDRGHPCDSCVKRNDADSCSYGKAVNHRFKAEDRLRQLEELVMNMVDSGGGSPPGVIKLTPSPSVRTDKGSSDGGQLDDVSSESKYVGSTHWSAILENIQELKTVIAEAPGESPETDDTEEDNSIAHDILFGYKASLSMEQVLSESLPPKLQVDRRLAAYFNAKYMVIPCLHTYQFQRQYEKFWEDPLRTSPTWVSILFSICFLSGIVNPNRLSSSDDSHSSSDVGASFVAAAAQCLVLGGFTRPQPLIVEALSLYAQCKYASSLDPSREVGTIFSIIIRHAYRMGYHRDPSGFPHMTIFEGEMRRRVWAMCRHFDLMISFQLGLPNCVPPDSWDTNYPRNLLDSEFDETTVELPPSRPENDATQILYFIVKARLMVSFGKVCHHAIAFKDSTLSEVMALDAQVRKTYSTIPEPLQIRPMSRSLSDSSHLIMVRVNCEFLHQKSLCVLHRKYMTQGFEYSTKVCVDAATAIVRWFSDMHKELLPGGQLYNDRWMLTSFTMNDFLLAAMLLCLSVSMWKKRNPGKLVEADSAMSEQLQMLRISYDICVERAPTSTESRKVAEALRVMLSQLPRSKRAQQYNGSSNDSVTTLPSSGQLSSTTNTKSEAIHASKSQAANTTLLFPHQPTPASSYQSQPSQPTQSSTHPFSPADEGQDMDIDLSMPLPIDLGPFETFLDGNGPETIDWAFLDQYIGNPDAYGDAIINSQHANLTSLPLFPATPTPSIGHWGDGSGPLFQQTTSSSARESNGRGGPNGTTAATGEGQVEALHSSTTTALPSHFLSQDEALPKKKDGSEALDLNGDGSSGGSHHQQHQEQQQQSSHLLPPTTTATNNSNSTTATTTTSRSRNSGYIPPWD